MAMKIEELQKIYTENIRSLRFKKNLTQERLSEMAGITQKFLSDIEIGRKWGSFETLLALSNALSVEPFELLLPGGQEAAFDDRRVRDLMQRLRMNLSAVVDTVEDFLTK